MQDNTKRFSDKVSDYVKYRPGYPQELFDTLYGKEGFTASSCIADIGAGTGIFSRYLLERGSKVFGVEPNEPMRLAAENYLSGYPNYVSVPATAEATTLENDSVDHITCAQAFHWFDPEACRKEFVRIIRPGGKIVLVWNRRTEQPGIELAYEELLMSIPDYLLSNHKRLKINDFEHFFRGGHWHKLEFQEKQTLDLDGFKGRHQSNSYSPHPGTREYQRQMEELEKMFAQYEQDGKIKLCYITEAFVGEL